jgi:porphobilinogen deaminase
MVAQLKQRFPDLLDYESRGSANLVVDASALGTKFGDDDLAAIKSLSDQIVIVDLSGTAVTDRSAPFLAAMKRARVLRFTNTKITDATVLALAGLDRLESLDLYGTAVTPACLKVAQSLPKLRHLYAGATKIPADAALPDDLKDKLVF